MGLHIKELVEKELEQIKQNVRECFKYLDEDEIAGLVETDLIIVAAIQNKQIIGGLAERFGLVTKYLEKRDFRLEVEEGQLTLIQIRNNNALLDIPPSPLGLIPGCGLELWEDFMIALDNVTVLDILALDIPEIIAVEICHQSGLIDPPTKLP